MSELQFDVIGAAGPKTFFSRLTKKTIAHSYLFGGAPGVGKKTFGRRLAQSLLCKRETVSEQELRSSGVIGYDGTCSSCKLFMASDATRHPDFLEHTGELKIGSTDGALGFHESEDLNARDIVRQLSLESYSGGMRVLLLGDIEFSTHHAANALLKFFEEPPDNVVLLLTTTAPGRLISTIRSRLVDVHFPPLARTEVREILKRMDYDAESIERGVSLAQGSVTRALAAIGGEEESLRQRVAAWFFDIVAGGAPEEGWATRETLDDGLETIKALTRDWVVIAAAGNDAPVIATDYGKELQQLPQIGSDVAIRVLAKIDDAQRLARTNVSPGMVSELVRMALTNTAR